jgi:hypothetical protein
LGFSMGAKEPPVLHILFHSIFGTRKGTNISVRNSSHHPFPSNSPADLATAAQSSISRPSLPLRKGQGTLQLVWGWPGSWWPTLGPRLSPFPSLSYSVPHPPFRCCSGGGREGQQAFSFWALAGPGGLGDHSPGAGTGPRPWHSSPSHFPHRVSPQGGVHPPSHFLGQLQQRSPRPGTPKSPVFALCVCTPVCACENLGAAEHVGARCVPDCGVALRVLWIGVKTVEGVQDVCMGVNL